MTRPRAEAALLDRLRPATHRVVPWLTWCLGEPIFRLMGLRRGVEGGRLATSRRILVVRLDEVGDVVMTSPFLRELRGSVPDAWITLVVKEGLANLVGLCPYVDEVLTYNWLARGPFRPLRLHLRALRLAREKLWPRGFDLAIVPRWDVDWHHATFVAYFSGARQRAAYSVDVAGYKRRLNAGYDRLFTRVLPDTGAQHEVERNLDAIRLMGGTARNVGLEAWLDAGDEAFAEQCVASYGLDQDRPLIVLGPGKRDRKRRWPLSHFLELGGQLVRNHAARLVVFGEAGEGELAEGLQRHLGNDLVNLVGRTTLRQTIAVLKRCMLYVGNDYGVKHLAAAAGVPVVEINAHPLGASPAHPDSPTHSAPWGVSHCVLQPERPRPPCTGACEAPDAHCIREITVERVETAVAQLLAESTRRTNGRSIRAGSAGVRNE